MENIKEVLQSIFWYIITFGPLYFWFIAFKRKWKVSNITAVGLTFGIIFIMIALSDVSIPLMSRLSGISKYIPVTLTSGFYFLTPIILLLTAKKTNKDS